LNSTKGCLIGDSFSLTFLHQPQCTILTNETDSNTFSVIFTKQSSCGTETPIETSLAWWIILLIVVFSVIGLVIVIILLVVPPVRKKKLDRLKTVL